MKVADLQQHLADLKKLLSSAGVNKTILGDLEDIHAGLQPFQETSLKDFANFLQRAEQYRAGGEVPIKPPSGRKRKDPKPVKDKTPAPDATALAREVRQLYDQAATPAVSLAMIEDAMVRIGGLSKDGLVIVAKAVDLKISGSATKPKIVDTIRRHLVDRKGSFQRAGLLDREPDSSTTTGTPTGEVPLTAAGTSS
jgi:hypothetical protein